VYRLAIDDNCSEHYFEKGKNNFGVKKSLKIA